MIGRIWKTIVALWKFLVGVLLCQSAVGAVLVVGWTYRLMQRVALRRWWKAAGGEGAFEAYLQGDPETAGHATYPNWIVAQRVRETAARRWDEAASLRGKAGAPLVSLLGSLWANVRVGVLGMANTWVVTILPVTFWAFGWYAGWNNSFNKGYEQYYVGIAISWIGIGLFIAAMFYLPMAQARQAVTGEWRSFYEFRVIRILVRRRAIACLLLAGCYALASLPVSIMVTAPLFFEQVNPRFSEMSDGEMLDALNSWFRFTAVVGLVAFVVLRVLAARVYASAIAAAVKEGLLGRDDLRLFEARALERLDLDQAKEQPKRHAAIRVAQHASRPFWRTSVVMATVVIWFSFVAQIYVREFLNYHPVRGWMNQPLVQLPWFRYVPDHLERTVRIAEQDDEDLK